MLTRSTLTSGLVLSLALTASAQDSRGRKYKAPPDTSHIEVLVLKDNNQKPIPNAAVVFHSVKDGRDEGNLEIKTNQEGKAVIDVIPTGSAVDVQVIADGFATFAGTYQVNETSRDIQVRMVKPRAQISTYVDNHGQTAARPLGLQEPNAPALLPGNSAPSAPNVPLTATPASGLTINPSTKPTPASAAPSVQTNPPNMHPDNQYPLDPATTSPNPARPAPTSPAPPQL